PAPPITDHLRLIAERMIEMMRAERGIGLAAPQAGVPWRLFVAHVPPSTDDDDDDDERRSPDATPATATSAPEVYINPRLSNPVGAPVAREEGCLSLPDIRGDVLRPPTITITALGLDGREFTRTATGLLARCWQHEVDHLD
ncbi:MAG: peptide deformylase, partial [Phycisphaerales bacterium]